jgi:uncharacterized repeat protein (TIGR01451 family)
MKKNTFFKSTQVTLMILLSFISYSQNYKPFKIRFDKNLKGDMLLIGNNILSKDNNNFNNNTVHNADVNMQYIDIDSDASTFSSSNADLVIPNSSCTKIAYAGLYWTAMLQSGDRNTINRIKFKLPPGGYNDITGEIIWDADLTPIGGNKPYTCYADVTSLLQGLKNPQGTYTIANVTSSLGSNRGIGLSAGWSLIIVYEDPNLPGKSITSFDGFSGISQSTGTLDINISGFRTTPVGPVRAKIAFAALEGDKPLLGDYLQINGRTISTLERPSNNFFNSSITTLTGPFSSRVPNGSNTLGFDAGILNIANPNGVVIKNGDTSATIRLGSAQDTYFYYFSAFAVDIIEPKIALTKVVRDMSGIDIGNGNVNLGDQLNYAISFKNTGNDNATSFTIRDQLPKNVIFNYPTDLAALPNGVTVQSYNAATREIIFSINNSVVEVGDGALEIRFKVKVVPSCNMLSDACSNSIDNSAFATYKGTLNPDFIISDEPSFNTSTGCLLVPKTTNFLVNIDNCKFTKSETLCGTNVALTAANGYSSYSWSTSPTGTPVIGTSQTFVATKTGTYYAHDTTTSNCLSINEEITVVPFIGSVNSNPAIPFANEVVTCPNDGKEMPNFFLCDANDSKLIQTGITDVLPIIWEKLDDASCTALTNENCVNESPTCTWTQVATGSNFEANTAGQYRLILNYQGGCFSQFYFNVYQNSINPTVSTDTNSNTLISNQSGATYQWFECPNTTIPDAINQSFTPTVSGNYGVIVTLNACSTISNCTSVSLLEANNLKANSEFTIYPNPSKGIINITTDSDDDLKIIDLLGQTVKTFKVTKNSLNVINVENLNDGLYFINGTKVTNQKLAIKR